MGPGSGLDQQLLRRYGVLGPLGLRSGLVCAMACKQAESVSSFEQRRAKYQFKGELQGQECSSSCGARRTCPSPIDMLEAWRVKLRGYSFEVQGPFR